MITALLPPSGIILLIRLHSFWIICEILFRDFLTVGEISEPPPQSGLRPGPGGGVLCLHGQGQYVSKGGHSPTSFETTQCKLRQGFHTALMHLHLLNPRCQCSLALQMAGYYFKIKTPPAYPSPPFPATSTLGEESCRPLTPARLPMGPCRGALP